MPLYPIIPLTPKLQEPIEIGEADRPRPEDVRQDLLRGDLRQRIEKVVSTLVDIDFRKETDDMGLILGYLARQGAKTFGVGVASRKADRVVAATIEALKADFSKGIADAP